MDFDDIKITHRLEALGDGRLTASTLAALAALVPDEAHVKTGSGSGRNESHWTWSAEWDHSVEADWHYASAALPDAPEQDGEPLTALDLLGRTETILANGDPRCQEWSDQRHARFGFHTHAQCRMKKGHSTLRNGAGHDFPKDGKQ
ncbi:hypothetical protein ACX80U_12195 [Arthrobacter sp. TmT3-37]